MDKTCYWDTVDRCQKERDCTPEEQAEIDARRAAALIPVVPQSIPKLNARLVLIDAGYWDDVVDFIAAQGPVALAYFEDQPNWRRDNELVNAWAQSRGKTSELDGLFIAGGNLKV